MIEIRFYAHLYASSFLVLWDHCADAGSWIRRQIQIYEGKYGYLRANTDICTVGQNNQHWLLAVFVFACPILARSQCWLFALRANTGKYPYWPSKIRICPQISVFAPEFNFRYLRSGLKDYMSYNMKFSISSLVSALDPYQPSSFAVGLDMGVSRLIPGPIWKMSCNNLLILTGSLTKTNRENINVKYNILNWRLAHHQNITWWNEY
jgi:hypothetical protein